MQSIFSENKIQVGRIEKFGKENIEIRIHQNFQTLVRISQKINPYDNFLKIRNWIKNKILESFRVLD